MSKICVMPWNSINLTTEGKMLPCCACSGEYSNIIQKTISIDEIDKKKSNIIEEIKSTMLEDKIHSACRECFRLERSGVESLRTVMNRDFKETYEKIQNKKFDEINIESLDIRFGNDCNLKCRMCNPYASRGLYKELSEYYGDSNYAKDSLSINWHKNESNIEKLINYAMKSSLIYFAGGEPLIVKAHWEYLKSLVKHDISKNITLRYNTNLTLIPNEAYELWPKFKKVDILCSLDGVNETYEYIRYPGNWNTIVKNFEIIKVNKEKLNLHEFDVYYTHQMDNIGKIHTVLNFIKNYEFCNNGIVLTKVTEPAFLNHENMTDEEKMICLSDIKKSIFFLRAQKSSYKIDNSINILKSLYQEVLSLKGPRERKVYLGYKKFLDQKRKQGDYEKI